MGVNIERKKGILLETFEVLKNDIESNSSELEDLIIKIAQIDFNLAVEMWVFLLQNYNSIHKYGNPTYHMTRSLSESLAKKFGFGNVAQTILNNDFLRDKLYKESAQPDYYIIGYLIDTLDLINAETLIQIVYSDNKNHNDPYTDDHFGDWLLWMITLGCNNINNDNIEFLLNWTEKVKDKEIKAKIMLKLIDFL
ncbi:hypothetical protein [Lysinibacillus sp. LZ02]|uniref:hypothetical protein n=1 Tax=Lysinibacillus sp. LZ02 TaxID=3420668 RepID=UPI003D36B9E0